MSDLSYLGIVPPSIISNLAIPGGGGVAVSLTVAGLIMYRVRQWKINATISAAINGTLGGGGTASATGVIVNDPFGAAGAIPTDEVELVTTLWNGFYYGVAPWSNANNFVYADSSTYAMTPDTLAFVAQYCDKTGSPIEAYFRFATPPMNGTTNFIEAPFTFTNGLDTTLFQGTTSGSGSYVLDAFNNVDYSWSCTVKPTSWWGYAGRFNTSTGAPL